MNNYKQEKGQKEEIREFYQDHIDLKIKKNGPETININDKAIYIVTITNNSTCDIRNITIKDIYGCPTLTYIPVAIVTLGKIINDNEQNLNSGIFTWLIPLMKPRQIAKLKFTLKPEKTGQILNYSIITKYIEMNKNINFMNNESQIITNVI